MNLSMKKVGSAALALCLVVLCVLGLGVKAQAANGYIHTHTAYMLEGVDGNSNYDMVAYRLGESSSESSDDWVVAYKIKYSTGYYLMDVVSIEEFQKIQNGAIRSSQTKISNLNEYMLSLGVPDEWLILEEKTYVYKELAKGSGTVKIEDSSVIMPHEYKYAAGKGITKITFDTTKKNGGVDVRISVDPSKMTKGFATLASTYEDPDDPIMKTFRQNYSNTFAQIEFWQGGSFGTTVKVAAKVDLSGLNKDKLVFYSYDSFTTKYTKLENTDYSIDDSGFLHFNTNRGGKMLITDKELTKK